MICWREILATNLTTWPIIEVIVGVFWFGSVLSSWSAIPNADKEDVAERSLGATVILAQLGGIVTGTSIIIAGLGAFVALATDVPGVAGHLRLAAVFAVLALAVALYTLAALPTRTPSINFVRSKPLALLCAMSLYFVLVAAIRFGLAVVFYLD